MHDRHGRADDEEYEEHREPVLLEAVAEGPEKSQAGQRSHAPSDRVVINHRPEPSGL